MLRHVCGLDIVYVLKHRDTRDMMPTMRLYDHNITNVVDQISALPLFSLPWASSGPSPGTWGSPGRRPSRCGPGGAGLGPLLRIDGVEHPICWQISSIMITPDVAIDWCGWNRHNSNISPVAVNWAMGWGFVISDTFLFIFESSCPISFDVKFWILWTSMDWVKFWPRNIFDVSYIKLWKVHSSVFNFGCWVCRGVDQYGIFGLLYEEITYIRMPPHGLEFHKNWIIQPFLSDFIGLLFAVDIRGKTWR